MNATGVAAGSRDYNGARDTSLSGSVSGVGNQTVLLTGSGLFDTPDVGTAKRVSGSVAITSVLNGLTSNYALRNPNEFGPVMVETTADVRPAQLTIAQAVAGNKIYDGTTQATTSARLSGLVGNESLTIQTTGSFDSPNAGNNRQVTGTVTLSNGAGGQASNYQLNNNRFETTANIERRPVDLTGVRAADKVYDRTTSATMSAEANNIVAGERVRLQTAGAFDSSRVGTHIVRGTATLLDGSDGSLASNYVVNNPSLTARASINARPVTIAATVDSKVYDGNVQAAVRASQVNNVLAGDQVQAAGVTARFEDPNVGQSKPVTVSVEGLSGPDAANYRVGNPPLPTSADITARPVSIAQATANNKVYDGTAQAVTSARLSGLVAGELLTVRTTGAFDSPNAGVNRQVAGTVTVSDGPGGRASNYQLAGNRFETTATIERRPVDLTDVAAADKVYDRTTSATVTASVTGVLLGQRVGLQTSANFDAAQVGTHIARGTATLVDGPDGSLASNYRINNPALTARGSITERPVAVVANVDSKVYDTTTQASLRSWQVTGVLPGDQVQVSGGTARFEDPHVGQSKPVVVTASGLAGADAGNYRLAGPPPSTTASITPATLTYVADPAVRTTGQPMGQLTGRVTGFLGNDNVNQSTIGTLQFAPVPGSAIQAGTVAVAGSGLAARDYIFAQAPGNATALALVTPDPTTQSRPLAALPTVSPLVEADRGLSNAVPSFQPDVNGRIRFMALDVLGRPPSSIASELNARAQYKQTAFSSARQALEANPDLADASPCLTLAEVDTGQCLVTERLQQQFAQSRLRPGVATAAAPAASVSPTPSAATALPGVQAQVAQGTGQIDISRPGAEPAAGTPRPGITAAVLQQPIRVSPIRTAGLPQIQRKVAVVIGIDNYTDRRIPTLDNARKDAEGVANVLSSGLGYETALILDGSKEAIFRRLNRLVLQTGPEDSVVIYFAGHGDVVEATRQGYWIPANANVDNPRTWISNNDIGRVISRIPSKQVALISDSCFSGSLVGGPGIAGAPLSADASDLLKKRAAVVMTSGGNEPVADTGKDGHSIFTYNLINSLKSLDKWRPGTNVFDSVNREVVRVLPQRPRYAAVLMGGHETGTDYLFEMRQLAPTSK